MVVQWSNVHHLDGNYIINQNCNVAWWVVHTSIFASKVKTVVIYLSYANHLALLFMSQIGMGLIQTPGLLH